MDLVNKHMYIIHESQAFSPIKSQQLPTNVPVSEHGFPILAIAVLGIMATAFLLVSYYIFVTKCFFNWQQIDPLRRFIRRARQHEDPLMAYSPSWQTRGLDELLIRQLPTFQFTKTEAQDQEQSRLSKCVVCLNEFQDQDLLRLLPKCSHAFHLDCIDIWLQSNTNCPLCRSSISGRNRYPIDRIIAPNSSPQEPQPYNNIESITGSDEDFVVIDFTGQDRSDSTRYLENSRDHHSSRKFEIKPGKSKPRKFHHLSIMGDECLNVRNKDEQFSSIQPIRRSFSMDSAVDRHVYLSVQEILRENRNLSVVENIEECSSSRSRRSIFSFGNGRGSSRRSAILPISEL